MQIISFYLINSVYSVEMMNLHFQFKVVISVQQHVRLYSKVCKARRHSEI